MRGLTTPLVEISCEYCGKAFLRREAVIRPGKMNFCSMVCRNRRCARCFRRGPLHDHLSPFRIAFHAARWRARQRLCRFELTPEALKELWDQQGGICPLTGWEMWLPLTTGKGHRRRNLKEGPGTHKASLDRIDSSGGYTLGNVRFVCLIAQYAKNSWSDSEVLGFCSAVVGKYAEDN